MNARSIGRETGQAAALVTAENHAHSTSIKEQMRGSYLRYHRSEGRDSENVPSHVHVVMTGV